MAFVTSFPGSSSSSLVRARTSTCSRAPAAIRAQSDIVPGIPSGAIIADVPLPVETYESRGFAEVLPKTWEGEIESIGVNDAEVIQVTSDGDRVIEVDAESSRAFMAFGAMVAEERAAALAKFNEPKPEQTGRATCGEEEGKETVSNSREVLVSGTKCVEYWGTQW